jgi:hypothetical protein
MLARRIDRFASVGVDLILDSLDSSFAGWA